MEKTKDLLNELLKSPVEFNNNQKGYNLLNQYLAGFDITTLFPVLESDNELIYRVAISIASELNEDKCSVLLPYLLPLFRKETSPLYLHYLSSAVFKGTYNNNYEEFSNIINQLRSTEYKVVASALDLISIANRNQLEASLPCFDDKEINEGILSLIKYKELDGQAIVDLIHADKAVLQLFGVVIAKKLYNKNPEYIAIAARSSNQFLSQFSKEVPSFNGVN